MSLSASESQVMKLNESSFKAPYALGNISLCHDKKGFFVEKDGQRNHIQNCWLDKNLRNITNKQLEAFLHKGYLSLNKMSDGEYTVKLHVRGKGGGFIAGVVGYWATKIICYGGAAAAATASVVATGPAVAAAIGATGAAATVTGGAVGATTALVSSAISLPAATATAVGGLVGAGATTAAATVTAASVTATLGTAALAAGPATASVAAAAAAAGTMGAVVTTVESLALGVAATLGLCPFLP